MTHVFPDELRRLLEDYGPLCVASKTDQGVCVLIKTAEFQTKGDIPVLYEYELGTFPEGACIRIYLEIYDVPGRPFLAETFLNPAAEADLALLQELCRQDHLDIHILNMDLEPVCAKRVPQSLKVGAKLHRLVRMAVQYNKLIPPEQLDFDLIKQRHQAARHMP